MVVEMVGLVQWVRVEGGRYVIPDLLFFGSHNMVLDMGAVYCPCLPGAACRTNFGLL